MTTEIQSLKKGYLFSEFTESELQEVVSLMKEREFVGGDYIFDEGSEATAVYIIRSGSVEISRKGSVGDEQKVAELSMGSHFGEMAFLDRTPRTASALARDAVKVWEISYDALEKLILNKPMLGLKLYKAFSTTLCRRIRNTTTDLSTLKELKLRHL